MQAWSGVKQKHATRNESVTVIIYTSSLLFKGVSSAADDTWLWLRTVKTLMNDLSMQ